MASHVSDWGHSLNQRRGQTSPHGDEVCGGGGVLSVVGAQLNSRTIPTIQNLRCGIIHSRPNPNRVIPVIGHGIGGKYIPIMARLAKGQTLE